MNQQCFYGGSGVSPKDTLGLTTRFDLIGFPKRLPNTRLTSDNQSFVSPYCASTTGTCALSNATASVGAAIVSERVERVAALVAVVSLVVGIVLSCLYWKRRQTYQKLVQCGLPTVYWHPKFSQYQPDHPKQLSSSSITNILPRMQQLKGPFDGGMYGTVYGLSTAVLHVAHPIPAMALLGATPSSSSATGTGKSPAYNHFTNFCGQGVFTADGDDWKTKRAAVLHSLLRSSSAPNGAGPTTFYDRIEQEAHLAASLMFQDIDRHIAMADAKGLSPYNTDIVPLLQRATIGLIYKYITHSDLSTLETNSDFVSSSGDLQSDGDGDLVSKYLKAITKIRMIILAQSRSIWFLLPRWCYQAFATLYQEEERTMGPIRQVAVAACRHAQPNSPVRLLLDRHAVYAGNHQGTHFSKNLIDEAITLLFAGQDTSAATLSWTLHLLTLHPHIQSKLAQEVCGVVNAQGDVNAVGSVVFTKKMIAQMPFLDAVIKESMRLYPVAPFVVRKVGSNMTIPAPKKAADGLHDERAASKDLSLPKDALACIWIYSLHRNPQFWNEPDEFRPERWCGNEDGKAATDLGIRTPGAYIPFAAGPRNCIGQPLANVALRCFLAQLVYRYEFKDERVARAICDGDGGNHAERIAKLRKDMQAGFTVLPRGGLTISIQHRR